MNNEFKVCPSYDSKIIVPQSAHDDHLKVSSHFRQHKRFPVLSLYYAPNKVSLSTLNWLVPLLFRNMPQVCLLRSAQPLVGGSKSSGKRCKEDETLLNSFLAASDAAHRGIVVDTRTQPVADMALQRQVLSLQ